MRALAMSRSNTNWACGEPVVMVSQTVCSRSLVTMLLCSRSGSGTSLQKGSVMAAASSRKAKSSMMSRSMRTSRLVSVSRVLSKLAARRASSTGRRGR